MPLKPSAPKKKATSKAKPKRGTIAKPVVTRFDQVVKPKIRKMPKVEGALPTWAWRARMKAGDPRFTKAKIDAAEKALKAFVAAVADDPKGALEDVVRALNALGGYEGKHGNFIETEEREELVPFLLAKARAAGLRAKGDPTEKLREW